MISSRIKLVLVLSSASLSFSIKYTPAVAVAFPYSLGGPLGGLPVDQATHDGRYFWPAAYPGATGFGATSRQSAHAMHSAAALHAAATGSPTLLAAAGYHSIGSRSPYDIPYFGSASPEQQAQYFRSLSAAVSPVGAPTVADIHMQQAAQAETEARLMQTLLYSNALEQQAVRESLFRSPSAIASRKRALSASPYGLDAMTEIMRNSPNSLAFNPALAQLASSRSSLSSGASGSYGHTISPSLRSLRSPHLMLPPSGFAVSPSHPLPSAFNSTGSAFATNHFAASAAAAAGMGLTKEQHAALYFSDLQHHVTGGGGRETASNIVSSTVDEHDQKKSKSQTSSSTLNALHHHHNHHHESKQGLGHQHHGSKHHLIGGNSAGGGSTSLLGGASAGGGALHPGSTATSAIDADEKNGEEPDFVETNW